MNLDPFSFAEHYDDGKYLDGIENADVILLGVSRAGKTPLCRYLAFEGLKAANIPLVPEADMRSALQVLPRKKLVGLIRSVAALERIRLTRQKYLGLSSGYADVERILEECSYADDVYAQLRCATLNMDVFSLEEAHAFIRERLAK